MFPVVEFALNNSVHASTGYTQFYVNDLTCPCVPLTLPQGGSTLGGGKDSDRLADVSPASIKKEVSDFLAKRLNVLRNVHDVMADSQDIQKKQVDAKSRGCINSHKIGDQGQFNLRTFLRM